MGHLLYLCRYIEREMKREILVREHSLYTVLKHNSNKQKHVKEKQMRRRKSIIVNSISILCESNSNNNVQEQSHLENKHIHLTLLYCDPLQIV
jgi:predicted Holliday junction resolvase-like endonuclease